MNIHLDEIDNDIASKHLLKHPFYLAWTRGELTVETLADYARQYYHHVAAFPTYLSAVHANCDDQDTRKQLLSNLIDEEAGSPNHPELWLQFAEALNVPKADVQNAKKWPETNRLIDSFRTVCGKRSTAEGLAALYAYESADPVEEVSFKVASIEMSNFVYPAYFEAFHEPRSVQFDHENRIIRPFQLLTGGYQIIFINGEFTDAFGSKAKAERFAKEDRRGHRSQTRKAGTLQRAQLATLARHRLTRISP